MLVAVQPRVAKLEGGVAANGIATRELGSLSWRCFQLLFSLMKFEHFALNVADVRAMARWYVEHLGFQIARRREDAHFTHFLADETGRIVIELYTNPAALIPNYANQDPLVYHLAVFTPDARAEQQRLEKIGATLYFEDNLPDGSRLTMMRDPWGVPLQLCQRSKPFPGF